MSMPPPEAMTCATESAGRPPLRAPARATSAFAPRRLEIAPERVLRVMGYRQETPIRTQVRRTAADMAALAATAATPAACYRRVPIAQCTPEALVLANGVSLRSPIFAAWLAGGGEVAAFVLSLGGRFDSTQKNLAARGQALEAYMLEIAGWLAIEETTRHFRVHLASLARQDGLVLTRRMAPGYSFRLDGRKVEWPLEDQQPLLSLFDDAVLPARLLEGGFAMTPKMSRSGLYGLRPAG